MLQKSKNTRKSIELVRNRRNIKEEEDEDDHLLIFPITDISEESVDLVDIKKDLQNGFTSSPKSNAFKPLMTLKQRRRSLLVGTAIPEVSPLLSRLDSGIHDLASPTLSSLSPKNRWKVAVKKIHEMKDPWKQFDLDKYPPERVKRHRYNALSRKWIVDEAIVKMENEPFNRGAMRSVFRLKKLMKIRSRDRNRPLEELLSTVSCNHGWSALSNNCVAKKYMENVDREVYFHDVELQMDAKLWGEEYNRHRPPKQVDIIQMAVLEFVDRSDQDLFHLENFIEGEYKKYNSNSGFVEDHWRMTPQAFTHFTFERSNHQMMVVDIQGVGDLYTDPQIHTIEGIQYGDGNLGIRGMALFFHSHLCNDICSSLGLSSFDLFQSEIPNTIGTCNESGEPNRCEKYQATQVRGTEEAVVLGTSPAFTLSTSYNTLFSNSSGCHPITRIAKFPSNLSPHTDDDDDVRDEGIASPPNGSFSLKGKTFLSGSDSSATTNEEEERMKFYMSQRRRSRPSCVKIELQKRSFETTHGDSILGLIHHELAKYHEMGRFVKEGQEIDAKAALFHEQQAADLGVVEASLTLAHIQLGFPHDILSSISAESENKELGLEFMKMAAYGNDRKAMLFLAKACETGVGLPDNSSPSYVDAVKWYERALENLEAGSNALEFDSTEGNPPYQIRANMAKLYLEGGYGLAKDPGKAGDLFSEAADGAMEAMNGKLANKYYALSEEAYAAAES